MHRIEQDHQQEHLQEQVQEQEKVLEEGQEKVQQEGQEKVQQEGQEKVLEEEYGQEQEKALVQVGIPVSRIQALIFHLLGVIQHLWDPH